MAATLRIVDRYIGKQILFSTLMGVVVLSLVLVLGNLFKKVFELLVDKDLPLDTVLKFIAYILPFSLIFTIPWGFLTAVLLVFGRLSADNELVSFRMTGMSTPRICLSVFVLAVSLTGVSLWINTSVAPKAQAEMKRAMYSMATDDPMALFVPDKPIEDFSGHRIYVEGREGNQLRNLHIVKLSDYGFPLVYLNARTAEVNYSKEDDALVLTMHGESGIIRDQNNPKSLDNLNTPQREKADLQIPLTKLREKSQRISPSQLTTDQLRSDIAENTELTDAQRSSMRTEISKRYSFSMACITFALVAVPLGVTAQRRETSIGFLFSLVIAFVYFLFIIIADTFRDDPEAYPHLLMWLPNIIFVALGLFLFRRLSKK